jgi:uncharacterized protein (DUF1697 family)
MPELKHCFEQAGFTNVKTVLSSGNVVFDASAGPIAAIEKAAEAAMSQHLGRTFYTIVRSVAALDKMLASEPHKKFRLSSEAKCIVSFIRKAPKTIPSLPIKKDGAQILTMTPTEIFSAYVPNPLGPVFMVLIEKTFGKEVTTRTWDTVKKCAKA